MCRNSTDKMTAKISEPIKTSTPTMHPLPASDEDMEICMRQLIVGVLCNFACVPASQSCGPQKMAHATMTRVVANLFEKHPSFCSAMDDIELDLHNMSFVGKVANIVFSEGINWGRVASVVAFGAVVCRHLIKDGNHDPSIIESVGHEISVCLLKHQRQWLVDNNIWDGFVAFFSQQKVNSVNSPPVLNTPRILHAVIMAVGIGLSFAWLSR